MAYGLWRTSSSFACGAPLSPEGTAAWLAGWTLFTAVGAAQLVGAARRSLWLGYALVLLGALLMTQGRCGSAAVDCFGRILFAVGVLLHQLSYYSQWK